MLATTAVVVVVLAFTARWLEPVLRQLEDALTYISTAVIIFAMGYVCAEVAMRYGFDSPLPGHLEGAELLVPIIVFFAVSYTQARNGHVGMTLVVDSLPERWHRALDIFTLTASVLMCAILSWFGAKYAYQLWEYDDVTMSPPYWRTWPSAAAISLGYLLLAIRMSLQILHRASPDKFPAPPPEDVSELHLSE